MQIDERSVNDSTKLTVRDRDVFPMTARGDVSAGISAFDGGGVAQIERPTFGPTRSLTIQDHPSRRWVSTSRSEPLR